MRILRTVTLALALVALSQRTHAEGLLGHWEGKEIKDNESVPIALDFGPKNDGVEGLISFSENGVFRWALHDLKVNGSEFTAASYGPLRGSHPVRGIAKGDTLTGEVQYGKTPNEMARIELKRTGNELSYGEEEVVFQNGDIKLTGTLLIPRKGGPVPGIVLMHGSGDGPREANFFFADYFARRGIAALCFDKRGSGGSTGNWRSVGFSELAEDGLAGVRFLQGRKEIDPKRIGMYGVSQAGWIMPMAASKSRDVAFLIVVSGGGVTVEREGYWDVEYAFRKKGRSAEEIKEALDYMKLNNQVTRTGEGHKELMARFQEIKAKPWFGDLGVVVPTPPNSPNRIWYRRIMDIDHVPIVKSLTIPAIWIYGEDDETFPSKDAAEIIGTIAKEPDKDFTIKSYPKADHGIRVPPPAGSVFPFRRFAEGYLDALDKWIDLKVTSRR